MWNWIYWIAQAALTAYSYFTRPRLKPSSPGADMIQLPRVEENRVIPVIYGTCLMDSPQIVWFGNKVYYSGEYGVKVWLALCHGPLTGTYDKIWAIAINNYGSVCRYYQPEDAWPYYKTAGAALGLAGLIEVEAAHKLILFNDRPGGRHYGLYFGLYDGDAAQTIDTPLGFSGNWPAHRGYLSVLAGNTDDTLVGCDWGNSSILPAIKIVVTRCPHNLTCAPDTQYYIAGAVPDCAGMSTGPMDANPAEIIYDLLTNQVYGAGIPTDWIDPNSFVAAAETLYAESFGMSLKFDGQESVEDMIAEVLKHIEGALYADPGNSGKLTLVLFRALTQWQQDALPELTVAEVISLDDYSRPSWFDLVNEVRVDYKAREWRVSTSGEVITKVDWYLNDRNAIAQEAALFSLQESFVSAARAYPGISQSALAAKVAARDLRELSNPLAHIKLTVNRHAYSFAPGDCFKLTWAPLGISDLICRVMEVDYGQLESGRIQIDAIEDVFATGTAIFADVPPSEWEPTDGSDPGTPTISVIAVGNTPPGSPSSGDRYIVGTSPTGDWVGHEHELATYLGEWIYETIPPGTLVIDETTKRVIIIDSSSEVAVGRYLRPVNAPIALPIAVDPTDPTKELRVNLASIATGTARTLTMPNKNITPMHVGGDTMSGLLNMGGNTISAGGLNQHGTVAQSASHSNPLAGKTIDLTNGMSTLLTLTGNIGDTGLTFSNWPAAFDAEAILYVKQAGSGSYTIVWSAEIDWGDAGQPVLSATPGQVDILKFRRLGPGSGTVYAELMGNGYTY